MTAVVSVQHGSQWAVSTCNSYFTATVFITIWSDILVLRSNITLSNRAFNSLRFRWIRWMAEVRISVIKI